MKKLILYLAAFIMMFLTACGSDASKENALPSDNSHGGKGGSLSIVTTIFPEYDWTKEILGDNPANAELTMLLDKGVDLHNYQPTADDIMKISECDVFIYVGGESDEWVKDALKQAVNDDMIVINLLEVLGDKVKEEELVEGMQGDEDEEAEADEEGISDEAGSSSDESTDVADGTEEEEPEYDEHVWLSLKNAEVLCDEIEAALEKIDPENAEVYRSNADDYIERLKTLDDQYSEAIGQAKVKTLLFGDRFPFRYMTDDYGLDYYAAFVGCSAETEASFETITFLAGKMDELGLTKIMTIEGSDHKIAESIIENTKDKNQQILTMDSLQSVTARDVADGADYVNIMESNLSVLKEALEQ